MVAVEVQDWDDAGLQIELFQFCDLQLVLVYVEICSHQGPVLVNGALLCLRNT